MKVLGLDLATHTGYAHGDVGADAPTFGTKDLPKTGDDIGALLVAYEDWLRDLISDVAPDRIFFEAPILSQRTITARKLMGLASETERLCSSLCVPCQEVNIGQIKVFFAGNGWAEKKHMIERAHALGWETQDDNQADACGIWLFGCATIEPSLRRFAAPKMWLPPKPRKTRKPKKSRRERKLTDDEIVPL